MSDNSEILLKMYGKVEVIADSTRRIESELSEHNKQIENLNRTSDNHSQRLDALEKFREINFDLLDKVKTTVGAVDHVKKHLWRYLFFLIIFVLIVPGLFTLWVTDYRAIDVEWARNVSQYIIDPVVDDVLSRKASHVTSSEGI